MEIGDWVNGYLYNGRITMVSNSFIFKEPVQNYSGDYPFLWDEINTPLRKESDFKLARKLFLDITEEICGEHARISESKWDRMQDKYSFEKSQARPLVALVFDESWVTFTIRYVVNYTKRRTAKDILYTRVLEETNKHLIL